MKPAKTSWVNLAVFEHQNHARALETFLQEHGFESRAYDDHWLRLFLFLRPPSATYRTQVRKSELDSALELISTDPSASVILERAIQCPSCGSLDVQYPQMTRKFLTPTLLLHAGIILRIIDHEAYCEECHFLWHLNDRRPVDAARPATVHHQRH